MKKLIYASIAGFIATVVISIIMIIKNKIGMLPELNPILDNATLVGMPDKPQIGWLLHFVIGTFVWGVAFAIFVAIWDSKPYWLRGFVFGILAWLAMMIGFMPIADHGLFALHLGIHVTIMTLVIHLIYGLVLGISYQYLTKNIN